MPRPSLHYTLTIFARLERDLPPLVPKHIQAEMKHALKQVQQSVALAIDDVEATVFVFGKKVWPYREAFYEFYALAEGELAESFLVKQLTLKLKKRYREFIVHGGTFRDLHSGHPATFFAPEERVELFEMLVTVEKNIRTYTAQRVVSIERERYEERIREFKDILADMERRLGALKDMAEAEQEHPELAAEIREQIRAFEYGLCLLGPRTSYEAVCHAAETVRGRQVEKKMHRRH